MARTERLAGRLVQRVPLFFGLKPEEMKRFLDICTLDTRRGGDILCEYNGASNSLFILLDGELEIVGAGDTILATIQAIDVVGEMGFISRKPRSATVRAKTASRVLRVEYHDFQSFAASHPETQAQLLRNMIRVLADRLNDANDLVVRYRKLYESDSSGGTKSTGTGTAGAEPPGALIQVDEARAVRELLDAFYTLTSLRPDAAARVADGDAVTALRRAGYSIADIEYACKWTVRNLPAVKRFNLVKLSIDEAFADRWST